LIFIENILKELKNNEGLAFCIEDTYYSYSELNNRIAGIINELDNHSSLKKGRKVAVVCTNDINTYASLLACWISGYAYVPLGLQNPDDRNIDILEDAEIEVILSTKNLDAVAYVNYKLILTTSVEISEASTFLNSSICADDLAYVLFTSGSTGKPKGVPITFKNLSAFLDAFDDSPIMYTTEDKCLQMYDLTFDISIASFLNAILHGCCIYTVSDKGVKYLNVLKIIHKYKVDVLQIVPSIIKLGAPLLSRLDFSHVKFCIVSGEATTYDLLEKIEVLMPNAKVYNYYGPTEATIYCSYHLYNSVKPKLYNGMLALGKPFKGISFEIVNPDTLIQVEKGTKGELLISGNQVTSGYLNLPEKNKASFVNIEINGESKIYYRSGDMCYEDYDNDFYYCGRFDNQVKVQGFRIELSEIEFKVLELIKINNVAIPYINKTDTVEIVLVIETKNSYLKEEIIEELKNELPLYMIPTKIVEIQDFPLNTSSKIDRVKLKEFVIEYFKK
jgi:amino acid adenylation domain-containing protein